MEGGEGGREGESEGEDGEGEGGGWRVTKNAPRNIVFYFSLFLIHRNIVFYFSYIVLKFFSCFCPLYILSYF